MRWRSRLQRIREERGGVYTSVAARRARSMVTVLAVGLPIVFAWLKLKGFPMGVIAEEENARWLLRVSLATLYLSWVLGTKFDIDTHELAYTVVPGDGNLPRFAYLAGFVIVGSFAALCMVDSYGLFSLILLGFWAINHAGLIYMVKTFVEKAVNSTKNLARRERDPVQFEVAELCSQFFRGRWHYWRSSVGFGAILCMITLAFTGLSDAIALSSSWMTVGFIQAASVALFVAVLELWIWHKRLSTRASMMHVIDMEKTYRIDFL